MFLRAVASSGQLIEAWNERTRRARSVDLARDSIGSGSHLIYKVTEIALRATLMTLKPVYKENGMENENLPDR